MAFIILVSIYAVLILVLAFGFARLEEFREPKDPKLHFISIIVPVRNEPIVTDFSNIDYPADKFEVIIVDDSDVPMRNATLRSPSPGKKAAITAGVNAARGEVIVTTDADCTVQSQWLKEINKAFQDPTIKMLVGGVRIEEDGTFFSRLQALEFVSVAVTGAATLGLGFPTMCNGANLAYRRAAFLEVGGYQGNEKISSGDDEFLMNKFHKESVRYLYSKDSLVTSSPLHLLTSFLSQRLRWAGKWRANTSPFTKIFAVIIFFFHVSFTAILVGTFTGQPIFLWLLLAKAFVEAVLLIPAAIFFGVQWRWIPFFVLQLVYSPYVIIVGILSQVVLPKWKGRAVEAKV